MSKSGAVFLISCLLSLSACKQADRESDVVADVMSQPVKAADHNTLHLYLGELEKQLEQESYQTLVDAIGYLKVYDTKNLTLEKFYTSLDGKTPVQIIEMANRLKSDRSASSG